MPGAVDSVFRMLRIGDVLVVRIGDDLGLRIGDVLGEGHRPVECPITPLDGLGASTLGGRATQRAATSQASISAFALATDAGGAGLWVDLRLQVVQH